MTPSDHCTPQRTAGHNGEDSSNGHRGLDGGCAGNADKFDPTDAESHWRDAYRSRPYVTTSFTFDDYGPAYRYGGQSWIERANRKAAFDEVERELSNGWERVKAQSRLTWEQAKDAARDGWDHLASQFRRESARADDDGMALDGTRGGPQAVTGTDSDDASQQTR